MAEQDHTYTFPDGRTIEVRLVDPAVPTWEYRLNGKVLKDQAKIDALIREAADSGYEQHVEPEPVDADEHPADPAEDSPPAA